VFVFSSQLLLLFSACVTTHFSHVITYKYGTWTDATSTRLNIHGVLHAGILMIA